MLTKEYGHPRSASGRSVRILAFSFLWLATTDRHSSGTAFSSGHVATARVSPSSATLSAGRPLSAIPIAKAAAKTEARLRVGNDVVSLAAARSVTRWLASIPKAGMIVPILGAKPSSRADQAKTGGQWADRGDCRQRSSRCAWLSSAGTRPGLSRYPRGTAFILQRSANETGDVTAAITRLMAFAASRGLSIKARY